HTVTSVQSFTFHFAISCSTAVLDRHSFPTRRSSDLRKLREWIEKNVKVPRSKHESIYISLLQLIMRGEKQDEIVQYLMSLDVELDRKSTRLNSSHVSTSYAVFCLKKNKQK